MKTPIPSVEAYISTVVLAAPPPGPELRVKLAGMLAPVRESIRNARLESR
jgi:hypothetical protein